MSEFDRGEAPNADSFTTCAIPACRAADSALCCRSAAFSPFPLSRNRVVQPANAEGSVAGLSRSPVTHVIPGNSWRWFGLRTSARDGVPARYSKRTTSPPIAPVPPVTRIMGSSEGQTHLRGAERTISGRPADASEHVTVRICGCNRAWEHQSYPRDRMRSAGGTGGR